MATTLDEVQDALLDKMAEVIAAVRPPSSGGGVTAKDALAVNQLAEAYAWLVRPGQSHGGAATPAD